VVEKSHTTGVSARRLDYRAWHGQPIRRPKFQHGYRSLFGLRQSNPTVQRLGSLQEALPQPRSSQSKRVQHTRCSLQEVPVRTMNSRVSFARRNGANAIAPDGGMPLAAPAPPRPLTPTMLEGRVGKILRMVESGTTFTICDLALEFNLSPSYLQRLFKHQTGVCMGEWINEQRLQRAAHLLANSYLSVKEIAHNVGYEHASSFIRAFERRFTQAPARYRKQTDYAKC